HTRSKRDWSSDVCSSDLVVCQCDVVREEVRDQSNAVRIATKTKHGVISVGEVHLLWAFARRQIGQLFKKRFHKLEKNIFFVLVRSEERRVWKECRWRRSP